MANDEKKKMIRATMIGMVAVALLTIGVAGTAAAEATNSAEREVVQAFERQLTLLRRQRDHRRLAESIEKYWRDNILIVAVRKSADDAYRAGLEPDDVAPFDAVTELANSLVTALDRLPGPIRRMMRGAGFYLCTTRAEAENIPALVQMPFLYTTMPGNRVYRLCRHGLYVQAPMRPEWLMMGLGMVVDLQISGHYWNHFRPDHRLPALRAAFGPKRQQFVSEMHSADNSRGYFSEAAKADSFWNIGEHFRAYVDERDAFEQKAANDPLLDFKFRYYADLFSTPLDRPRTPRLDAWKPETQNAVPAPITRAEPLDESAIIARWREKLRAFAATDRELAAKIEQLFRDMDLLIVPVSRDAEHLYRLGLGLDDISEFAPVKAGVNAVFVAYARLTESVRQMLRGTAVYVSSRQGRSYAIASPFATNRRAEVLRNLRQGFIFERLGPAYSEQTAVHEFGHVVDSRIQGFYVGPNEFRDLRDAFAQRRKEWVDRFPVAARAEFLNDYAASNSLEDFAECFRMYLCERELFVKVASENRPLSDKFQFMQDLFSHGVAAPNRR